MDSLILEWLTTYQLPAILIGSFLFGETVILSAAFLAGQGVWPVGNVFLLALAGTLISDILWFLLGNSILHNSDRWKKYEKEHQHFLTKLEKITGRKPFLSLLFIKFLYGTRILTILYLAVRKVTFAKFFVFGFFGTLIWLGVLLPIGWSAGKGLGNFVEIIDNIGYVFLAILALIIIYRAISIWMEKRIEEE